MMSPFHRGDYRRVRRSVVIALLELEALEPRMQLAYKRGHIPASCAADLSLARLLAEELDKVLRLALDVSIGDAGQYYDVYADSSYNRQRLVS
jgi:hypothetical protein